MLRIVQRVWLLPSLLVCACGDDAEPVRSSAAKGGNTGGTAASGGSRAPDNGEPFSFFVTSYAAIQRLSGSANGFGGDLRYGEADGLAGADKICSEIAETSLPGARAKGWRAFLSVTKGSDGAPVHAIDRIGEGPWYDRLGRIVAMTRAELLNVRPSGADPAIINDLPNEDGIPNHAPDGAMQVDNHDTLTGTNAMGQLSDPDWKFTCHDWTTTVGTEGTPRVGHSWFRSYGMGFGSGGNDGGGFPGRPAGGGGGRGGPPGGGFPMGAGGSRGGGGFGNAFVGGGNPDDWKFALVEAGCAAGASLVEMGPPNANNPTVGSGGGYGGFYCFALRP